ncbi:ROK family protein [Alicyclobacillus fastidiosus]|uniref:ROK family protein n=1 Tax=Alicyclobacillus fastidiosus TaxID=392011 RepID=A0ABV5A8Q3_9BACL|nr:ROK family protein [Alicyclobacillus fastidiosus]WEH10623.1 ROK family protein [Alicyclobacillus fastidiosus]
MSTDFVLAFDYGGTKIAVGTATIDGQLISRRALSTKDYGDAESVVQAGIEAGQELVAESQGMLQGSSLISVGVSTMGVTYPDHVLLAPNVPGWTELRMHDIFGLAFKDIPIQFENDVKCAAFGELRRGELQDTDYGIYVNLGTGIMVALTCGDQVMEGHHRASGEIAYNLRTPRDARGFRDGVAPFEELVGGRFIGLRAGKRFQRPMTSADVFEAYRQGDEQAILFVDEVLAELGYHLANLCNVWNPQRVVFGAGMVASHDVILPFLSRYFEKFVPFPPELRVARFHRDAGLHGAVELAISAQRSSLDISQNV